MTFDEWVSIGIERGWCGPPVCETHDGLPMSFIESDAMLEGADICIHIVRLYDHPETKEAVEDSHAPSVWRKDGWA